MTGGGSLPALLVLFGNQLFAPRHLPPKTDISIYMAEDRGLCTYVRHHQQKIVLFLAAMRAYADELEAAGYQVHYQLFDADRPGTYEDRLEQFLQEREFAEIRHFEIEDKPMEQRLIDFAASHDLSRTELRSPMFSCSRAEFAAFAKDQKRLVMGDFYKQQRKRLGILVDRKGRPRGGRWTFDEDNRKKLPKNVEPPALNWPEPAGHVTAVVDLVNEHFADHPGRAEDFRWPTTREQAKAWLDEFVDSRLRDFGPYEDAMTERSATVFHSVLSPSLNLGLLTPDEAIDAVIERADEMPLQSVEGFVRQVIGWREFVRGIYRQFSKQQEQNNFWGHQRGMTAAWYSGTTGIPPLDDAITTAIDLGWTHHIPRLMVLGNLMTLSEIRPNLAHRWFMEMYVDSSEWVMGPNVHGMGIFSDGGIFATKPYICGSNYMLKMSDYKKGDWCDIVDGLYWRFVDKHRDFFSANPRSALMPKALDRLKEDRKALIFDAAERFLDDFTVDQASEAR
jgi:deoxyribodipyrimidine photolyase-related protein